MANIPTPNKEQPFDIMPNAMATNISNPFRAMQMLTSLLDLDVELIELFELLDFFVELCDFFELFEPGLESCE